MTFQRNSLMICIKKYTLPRNCNLNVPTVNVEIWNLLSKYQKREDLKFQKLQKTIVKTVSANIELMNEIIEKPNIVNTQKVAQIISDSTALLGNVAHEISIKRRLFCEWQLNPSIFKKVTNFLSFIPDIDCFANRINTQLSKYISYRPDPNAYHVDAFSVSWKHFRCYLFPPFSLIGRVL